MKKPKDIRTLCYRCMMDMHNAGYKLRKAKGKRSICDKCNRPGSDWEMRA